MGRILTVTTRSVKGVTTIEDGEKVYGYIFHQVFTDGQYVYDPFLSRAPVPLGDWRALMRALNPGATIR